MNTLHFLTKPPCNIVYKNSLGILGANLKFFMPWIDFITQTMTSVARPLSTRNCSTISPSTRENIDTILSCIRHYKSDISTLLRFTKLNHAKIITFFPANTKFCGAGISGAVFAYKDITFKIQKYADIPTLQDQQFKFQSQKTIFENLEKTHNEQSFFANAEKRLPRSKSLFLIRKKRTKT